MFKSIDIPQRQASGPIRRHFLVTLLLVGLAAFTSFAFANGEPEDMGNDWVATADANARAAAGDCHDIPNARCMEWCTLYQGGVWVSNGFFCCVDESTGQALSCSN